jgi:beta-xylosidase
MEGPVCEATVAIDLRNMKNGDRAGFSAFNSDATLLAIRKTGDRLYLSMDEEKVKLANDTKAITHVKQGSLTDVIRLRKPVIYLRIEGDFRPGPTKDIVKFWYSLDNKKWKRLGPDCRTSFDWQRFFMGTKFAIFNYTTADEGGYIDIDWFQYHRNN